MVSLGDTEIACWSDTFNRCGRSVSNVAAVHFASPLEIIQERAMNRTLRFAARLSRSPTTTSRWERRGSRKLGLAVLMLGFAGMFAPEPAVAGYFVTNLVSDLPGVAAT